MQSRERGGIQQFCAYGFFCALKPVSQPTKCYVHQSYSFPSEKLLIPKALLFYDFQYFHCFFYGLLLLFPSSGFKELKKSGILEEIKQQVYIFRMNCWKTRVRGSQISIKIEVIKLIHLSPPNSLLQNLERVREIW